MKFTGAILLWTAFTLTGTKISSLLKNRVSVMDETLLLLNSLEAEIHFARSDIGKIFNGFSSDNSMKSLTFLNGFADFNASIDFHFVWRESIASFPLYKREEKDKLLLLGSFLGTTDAESQISTIKLYVSFFENYREKAIADNEKYGKVASLFGLFFGASVFILLL